MFLAIFFHFFLGSGSGLVPKVLNLNRTGLWPVYLGGDSGTEEAVVDLAKDFGGIMKQ